ncbi:hypothetical protein K3728_06125 [Rhodobacteraceae bacterium M385]|nr:hypothetical protein K3728_06125 [Rhodobacteraceae bacterium M385]
MDDLDQTCAIRKTAHVNEGSRLRVIMSIPKKQRSPRNSQQTPRAGLLDALGPKRGPVVNLSSYGILSALALALCSSQAGSVSAQSPMPSFDPSSSYIRIEPLPEFMYLTVLERLEEAGYTIENVTTTWLQRLRIRAVNSMHRREIVVSPTNGLILRDAIIEVF